MTENSFAGDLGRGVVGVGIGFGLYLLISGLGFGGRGEGSASGAGTGPVFPSPTTAPPRPRDEQSIHIVVQPSPTDPKKAVIKIPLEDRFISVGELVTHINAGGRKDVHVTVTGATRQGAWLEIRDALERAGVQIFLLQPSSSSRVSGNARGQYGRAA